MTEKGEWVAFNGQWYMGVSCSCCGAHFDYATGAELYKFCPMCGKQMDLEGRVENAD